MDILQKAGISPNTFTAYLVRSATTSSSIQKRLSLNEISNQQNGAMQKHLENFVTDLQMIQTLEHF